MAPRRGGVSVSWRFLYSWHFTVLLFDGVCGGGGGGEFPARERRTTTKKWTGINRPRNACGSRVDSLLHSALKRSRMISNRCRERELFTSQWKGCERVSGCRRLPLDFFFPSSFFFAWKKKIQNVVSCGRAITQAQFRASLQKKLDGVGERGSTRLAFAIYK